MDPMTMMMMAQAMQGGKGGGSGGGGSMGGGAMGGLAGAAIGGIQGAEQSRRDRYAREEVALKNMYAPYYNQGLQTMGPKEDKFAKAMLAGAQQGFEQGKMYGGDKEETSNPNIAGQGFNLNPQGQAGVVRDQNVYDYNNQPQINPYVNG